MRFYWSVHLTALREEWFQCGFGQCGIDPMLRISGPTALECMLRRWKPAHTDVLFNYSLVPAVEQARDELIVLTL
jgi:uncharacterized protein YmfQ (DUF2313 family)